MTEPAYGGGVGKTRGWVLVGLTVVAAVVVFSAPPALAHTSLLSSTPADSAELDAPPAVVELVFTEPVNPELVTVVVTNTAGTQWQAGAPVVSAANVSQPLQPLTEAGEYVVAYRVVSADGHPVTGQVGFVLRLPVPASSNASTASTSVTALPTSTPVAARAQPPSTENSASSSAWTYAAIGLPVAALLFAVGMGIARSRARSRGGTGGHGR
ncbi:MAG TPA: copper resistance CopC family protein [Actinomycetes bacterium]|nr:copper resistance CopC family protein [Actinomycetes bacterium]